MKSFTRIFILYVTAHLSSAAVIQTPETQACKNLEIIGTRLMAFDYKQYKKTGGKGKKLYNVDLNACVANMGGQLKFEGESAFASCQECKLPEALGRLNCACFTTSDVTSSGEKWAASLDIGYSEDLPDVAKFLESQGCEILEPVE